MRITHGTLASNVLNHLHAALTRIGRSQTELASGRTIQRPSDDPTGTGRALQLREVLAQNEQYQRNVGSAKSFLDTTASTLQSMVDLLQRARQLAVQAGSDALDAGQRAGIEREVEQILRQSVAFGNAKHQSYYLFGGTKQTTAPYTLVEGVTFSVTPPVSPGNVEREIGVGQRIVVNVPGDTVLPPVFDALSALRNALAGGTPADVRQTISRIDSALSSLLGGVAEVGARLNRLELADQRYEDVQINLKALLSEVEDADLADVITNLSMQQTTYQAALATGAKLLQTSLIDFLR